MKYILELEDEPNKEYFGEENYYRCKQIPYWSISESMRNRLEPYDEANRKTESNSEIPNNCEACKHWWESEEVCLLDDCQYEPQTDLVNDSQVLVKDLVDDEFNPYDEECMRCKHLKLKCEFIPTYCKFESRDEPQAERSSK